MPSFAAIYCAQMADYSCFDCNNHWDSLRAFKVIQTIQPDWCLSIIAHITFLTKTNTLFHTNTHSAVMHHHTKRKYRHSVLCVFFVGHCCYCCHYCLDGVMYVTRSILSSQRYTVYFIPCQVWKTFQLFKRVLESMNALHANIFAF